MPRFNEEPPTKPDRSHYLNNPPDTGLDLDMLTDAELEELGYKVARQRHKNAVSAKPKCSECRKAVSNPVTSYVKHGYDFVEPGEILHEQCARGRYEALNSYLKQITGTDT